MDMWAAVTADAADVGPTRNWQKDPIRRAGMVVIAPLRKEGLSLLFAIGARVLEPR